MKVAFVSSILGYPWGGPDRLWTNAARRLLDRGDSVLIGTGSLVDGHDAVRMLQASGATLCSRKANSVYTGMVDAWRRRMPLTNGNYFESHLAAYAPDVVFITQGGSFDMLAEHHLFEWLRSSATPYVLVCHQGGDGLPLDEANRGRCVDVFSHAAHVCFVSLANKVQAEHQMCFRLPQATIIQNPLAFEMKKPLSWPGGAAGPAVLFAVGRMDIRQKGWDLFLAAASKVARDHDFIVRLAGRGPDAAMIRSYAEYYGISSRLELSEFLGAGEIQDFWRSGELFLLPSRAEGCASTMLEAMACGRPQLVTPVGGVSEWVTHVKNAFVSEAVSVEALESALRLALEQRERWPEMGRAARAAFDARRDRDPVGTIIGVLEEAALRSGKA